MESIPVEDTSLSFMLFILSAVSAIVSAVLNLLSSKLKPLIFDHYGAGLIWINFIFIGVFIAARGVSLQKSDAAKAFLFMYSILVVHHFFMQAKWPHGVIHRSAATVLWLILVLVLTERGQNALETALELRIDEIICFVL